MNKEIIVPKILLPYYYSWKINNKNTNYNVCFSYKLIKNINLIKMKESICKLVDIRPNLRANFKFKNNEIKYVINNNLDPIFYEKEIYSEEEYNITVEKLTKIPHDLHNESLLKVNFLKRNYNEDIIMLFNIHHSIIDGTSLDKFISDLPKIYHDEEVIEETTESHLSSMFIQKKNTEILENSNDIKIKNYIKLLNEISSVSEKYDIKEDEKIISSSEILDKNIYSKLSKYSAENEISIFNILLNAWCIFEAKLFNKDNLIVSYPVNIRNDKDETGCIINNINYPFIYNKDFTFDEAVHNFKLQMPLLKKLHYLNEIDIFDKSDSYCSHFAYSGFAKLKDLIFKNEIMNPTAYPQMAKSAFGMKYIKFEDNLYFLSEVYENILPQNISSSLAHRFNQFLDKILTNSNEKLYKLDTLNTDEFNDIVYEQNKTEKTVKNTSLPKYFNEIVQNFPDKIAAIDEFKSITYIELDKKSNQLARLLENHTVKKDDIIAILIDNRIEMLIAILGVLKIGAIYLPISPDTPKERIDYILKDSNAKKLLSTKKLENENFKNIDFIDLEEIDYHNLNSNDLHIEFSNMSAAYIIYTSGSTGNPKGVLVNQNSVINLIECCIHKFNLTNEDSLSKYSSFSFDASVIEIFCSLMSGACLYFIPNHIKFDIYKLNEFFNENNITFSFLTTKFAEIFMNLENRSLKNLLVGGEKLKYLKKTSYNITNAYGPTETTVLATMQDLDIHSDNIPIGKPIQNAKIYILDNEFHPRNYSMEGEIYIGGEILAQSYINNDMLTESKFISNPFQTEKEKELGLNSKLYRTGDIGKKLESGEILISGRTDFQVKIYGYRIELNEIEQQILNYPNITNVTIKAFNDKQDHKYLCAYFEAIENIEVDNLKKHIENHLPAYMIPKFFVQLEKLPLNYNGKVDLKSLKEPDINSAKTKQYIAPSTPIEEMISQKFSEILCCENISIHDDFFLLGGNSIKSILLLSKLQEDFVLDLSQIYSNKSIFNLAKNIKLK